jgi:hypothetical protein
MELWPLKGYKNSSFILLWYDPDVRRKSSDQKILSVRELMFDSVENFFLSLIQKIGVTHAYCIYTTFVHKVPRLSL